MRFYVLMGALILMASSSFAAQKKFLSYGGPGASGVFKSEITLFEEDSDSKIRCMGCKNFRVIVDVLAAHMPLGPTYPTAIDFDTKEACGEYAVETPMADIRPLYRMFNSPTLTKDHPLLLQINPSVCKGNVKLVLLHEKCMNPSPKYAKECKQMVEFKSYEIPLADLQQDLKDVDIDSQALPNLAKSSKAAREPSSASTPAKTK